jgi:hypothetical protein
MRHIYKSLSTAIRVAKLNCLYKLHGFFPEIFIYIHVKRGKAKWFFFYFPIRFCYGNPVSPPTFFSFSSSKPERTCLQLPKTADVADEKTNHFTFVPVFAASSDSAPGFCCCNCRKLDLLSERLGSRITRGMGRDSKNCCSKWVSTVIFFNQQAF